MRATPKTSSPSRIWGPSWTFSGSFWVVFFFGAIVNVCREEVAVLARRR